MAPKPKPSTAEDEYWTTEHNDRMFAEHRARFPPPLKLDKGAQKTCLEVYDQYLRAMEMRALPCLQLALAARKPMNTLLIHSHIIDEGSAILLGHALSECCDIKAVRLLDVQLHHGEFFRFLGHNPSIISLTFEYMVISPQILSLFVEAACYMPFLTTLAFCQCKLECVSQLAQFLSSPGSFSIRNLNLNGSIFGPGDLELLGRTLAIPPATGRLDYSRALRVALKANTTLRFINLSGCRIRTETGMWELGDEDILGFLQTLFQPAFPLTDDLRRAITIRALIMQLIPAALSVSGELPLDSQLALYGSTVNKLEPIVEELRKKIGVVLQEGRDVAGYAVSPTKASKPKPGEESTILPKYSMDLEKYIMDLPERLTFSDVEVALLMAALCPAELREISFELMDGGIPTSSSLLAIGFGGYQPSSSVLQQIQNIVANTSLCKLLLKDTDITMALEDNLTLMKALEQPIRVESRQETTKRK
ncbi:hypothetical protein GMRT_15299 [Giardia muris]|uniref:Uncharacterized protein n=1 Tax=Giardia muris TaxID=5742 RepID=A0A4Z1SSZ3_GIAMU|nr:hypothetical protein GMRT_15299 [Giardia muris]|eukprot:TNJ28880.1 hypothetical protein GMRT_15299 [Giardia muris]